MALVPADFPQRLAARGLQVQCFAGWDSHGGSADHRAVVVHHTASSSSARPEDDAAYCHHGSSDSPLYNVLVDRYGVVWLLAREKSNSSGKIASTPLNEALNGQAGYVSAGARGYSDDTSANDKLFAIACQNNGTGEPWSAAMLNATYQVAAEALQCLGLPHAGYLTQHRVLTARKVDNCGDSCPQDFQPGVTEALGGGRGPAPEEAEMWVLDCILPAPDGDEPGALMVGLPFGRKSARVDLWLDCDHSEGAGLWGSQAYEGGAEAIGLWADGHVWELWLPGRQRSNTGAEVDPNVSAIHLQNRGPRGPVHVTVSGT